MKLRKMAIKAVISLLVPIIIIAAISNDDSSGGTDGTSSIPMSLS